MEGQESQTVSDTDDISTSTSHLHQCAGEHRVLGNRVGTIYSFLIFLGQT